MPPSGGGKGAVSALILFLTLFFTTSIARKTKTSGKRFKENRRPSVIDKLTSQIQSHNELHQLPPVYYGTNRHPFEVYQTNLHLSRALQRSRDPLPKPRAWNGIYEPVRIHFDTTAIDQSNPNNQDKIRIEVLKETILPHMAANLGETYSVVRAQGPIPIIQGSCFNLPRIKTELSEVGVPDADLVVYVFAQNSVMSQEVCCEDCGTLSAATACELDQFDRPVTGFINFCLNELHVVDGQVPKDQVDRFIDVGEHELTHVLGFHTDLFKYFRNPITGEPLTPRAFCLSDSAVCVGSLSKQHNILLPSTNTLRLGYTSTNQLYYEIVTPTVVAVVRNQFGCERLTGARLENQPTNEFDCFGTHFEERLFYPETMSAFFSKSGSYSSALTFALLEDSGWYKANYSKAEVSPFGHLAGCGFVEEDCIVDGTVPEYSKGFFCNTVTDYDDKTGDVRGIYECDHSHLNKGFCDLVDTSLTDTRPPPENSNYFLDTNLGPKFKSSDWCPVVSELLDDLISCEALIPPFSSNAFGLPETYDKGSRCFNVHNTEDIRQALCLGSYCNMETRNLEITVEGWTIYCEKDFDRHDYPNNQGLSIECPRLSAICPNMFCPANCSGRGRCDTSGEIPKCVCFNSNDTSDGCYQTEMQVVTEGHVYCGAELQPGAKLQLKPDAESGGKRQIDKPPPIMALSVVLVVGLSLGPW